MDLRHGRLKRYALPSVSKDTIASRPTGMTFLDAWNATSKPPLAEVRFLWTVSLGELVPVNGQTDILPTALIEKEITHQPARPRRQAPRSQALDGPGAQKPLAREPARRKKPGRRKNPEASEPSGGSRDGVAEPSPARGRQRRRPTRYLSRCGRCSCSR
jgi:hypothetical protein